MAVPKKRKSHSRTRTQRSHDALAVKPWLYCPQCREAMRPHTVCACGFYRGQHVVQKDNA